MSKSTLGRGLGDLLGGSRPTDAAPGTDPAVPPRPVDGGLRILIEGAQREPEVTQTSTPVVPVATPTTPRPDPLPGQLAVLTLLAADLALLGWTGWHVATHLHTMGWAGLTLCAASTLLAALCGCAAVLILSKHD